MILVPANCVVEGRQPEMYYTMTRLSIYERNIFDDLGMRVVSVNLVRNNLHKHNPEIVNTGVYFMYCGSPPRITTNWRSSLYLD